MELPKPTKCSLHGDMYLPTWCKQCQDILKTLGKALDQTPMQ